MLTKLLRLLAILLGVTLAVFLLMHAIPGTPWSNYSPAQRAMTNTDIDAATQRALERRFGLDLPLWRQFTRYLLGDFDEQGRFVCGAVCGNLGPSIRQRGRSVQDVLFAPPEGQTFWQSRFGYSIRLVALSGLIAAGLGLALGALLATRPKSPGTRALSVGLAALVSIPNFVLGWLVIVVFASWLGLISVLPDWDVPGNWLAPALVLAAAPLASIARVTQAALDNILHEDYIRTAHAKGLSRGRVLRVHVLRNALAPISVFLGPTLIELFTGLLIVENLYAFPGFGREYWGAVLALDYPMILGLTLLYATAISLVNLLIDVLNETLDARLRAASLRGDL